MTSARILQIVHEEINRENGLLFEGVTNYTPHDGYRNNKLIESNYGNGRQLLTEGWLDTVQSVLDYAGIIPGIGIFLDVVNAGISYFRNNILSAILNLIAAIPGIDLIVTPFKWILKKLGSLTKPILKMFQGGLSASKLSATFMKAIKGASKTARDAILKLYKGINAVGDKALKWLSKINVANFNKKVVDYTYGWFALPGGFVRAADGFIGRLKNMFKKFATDESKIVREIHKEVAETKLTNDIIDWGVTEIEGEKVKEMESNGIINRKEFQRFGEEWKNLSEEEKKKKFKDSFVNYIKVKKKVTLKGATCFKPRETNGWLAVDGDKFRNKMGNVRKGTVATVDGLKTKVTKVSKDGKDRPFAFKFKNNINKAEKVCLQISKGVGSHWITSKINTFMLASLEKQPIQLWSKGKTVEIVQKALGGLKVDGIFGGRGSNTEKAVKKFQKSVGMVPDGVVGPKTWLQLV